MRKAERLNWALETLGWGVMILIHENSVPCVATRDAERRPGSGYGHVKVAARLRHEPGARRGGDGPPPVWLTLKFYGDRLMELAAAVEKGDKLTVSGTLCHSKWSGWAGDDDGGRGRLIITCDSLVCAERAVSLPPVKPFRRTVRGVDVVVSGRWPSASVDFVPQTRVGEWAVSTPLPRLPWLDAAGTERPQRVPRQSAPAFVRQLEAHGLTVAVEDATRWGDRGIAGGLPPRGARGRADVDAGGTVKPPDASPQPRGCGAVLHSLRRAARKAAVDTEPAPATGRTRGPTSSGRRGMEDRSRGGGVKPTGPVRRTARSAGAGVSAAKDRGGDGGDGGDGEGPEED